MLCYSIIPASGVERDFVPVVSMPITFPPFNERMQTRVVQITVIDDMFVENDENITSVITLSANGEPADLNPDRASIIIINDDGIKFVLVYGM